jgi:hypothetical protein
MGVDLLKRIRKFVLPVTVDGTADAIGAANQQRQLVALEQNVSDMGAAIALAAAPRLTRAAESTVKSGATVGPGQYHVVDTRTTGIRFILSKPTANDSGKLVVVLDIGGSASSVTAEAQGCTIDGVGSVAITVPNYAMIIFCDGANYWRV